MFEQPLAAVHGVNPGFRGIKEFGRFTPCGYFTPLGEFMGDPVPCPNLDRSIIIENDLDALCNSLPFKRLLIGNMPLRIIRYPHPTLRHRSKPVRRVDKALRGMVAEMFDLMYEHEGVGLAANQVDLPIRLFVVNPAGTREDGEELVIINPEIQRPRGNESAQEGCLSLPGLFGQVKRPKTIRLSAFDLKGNAIEREIDGFLARVIQHENRMTEEAKRDVDEAIGEMTLDFRSQQETGSIPNDETLIARLAEWEQRYA